jgi:pimeloyl-ACP methyl ester carboxylesterase
MAGDASLTLMAGWLRALGYAPCRAQIRANVDCSGRAVARLETQLERAAQRHGRAVTIIGQSRGGTMARVLAVRRPDLVEAIACLGSPLRDEFAVHPLVTTHIHVVGTLGSLGVPGLFTRACRDGECCRDARAELHAPVPSRVAFLSVYSRSDGIVAWRSCLDPQAEQVEVSSSHCGMSVNPQVYRVVKDWLAARQTLSEAPAPRVVRLAAAA